MQVNSNPQNQFFLSVQGIPGEVQPLVHITLPLITSGLELPGYHIVRSCGIARGITVRSRNVCATICAVLCSLGGGRNSLFTELCEQSRDEALQLLVQQAQILGGNAIIGFRYEAHDIYDGITEVLAYGTAVVVEENTENQLSKALR